ncbi:hypothetical protein HNY73_007843 [Argiope bruennichi]|uniref:Chitin-binding type-2 domain-containing protein n=1 Tax=Argiope bruennichi TaxID=94029 RepID=A0A8T0F6X5_ARGBR|nr:hypothetical protein HNY73_007843 [Argiope bruennichi]
MDAKAALLAIVLLLSVTYISFADKGKDHDDDDDPKDDDSDDDGGMPNYCPEDDGMFPNPTDCATYYNCVDGTAIAMSCAPGLLFDAEKKMCNFADRVKCKNQCRGPNGMFPSQHRCDEFVLCTNNKPKVKRCKKGLYFDPNLQVCNYKDQVLCSLPGGGKKGNKTDTGKKIKAEKQGNGATNTASLKVHPYRGVSETERCVSQQVQLQHLFPLQRRNPPPARMSRGFALRQEASSLQLSQISQVQRNPETQAQAEQTLPPNGRHFLEPGQLQHFLLLRRWNGLPTGMPVGSFLRRGQFEVRPPQSRRLCPAPPGTKETPATIHEGSENQLVRVPNMMLITCYKTRDCAHLLQ